MRNREKKYIILLVLAVGLFLSGIIRLFTLRFEEGDIYPAYSSLRKDPLGTGILYEGLQNIPDVSVRRNYKPFYEAEFQDNETLLYLGGTGLDPNFYDKKSINRLEQFVSSGGRLVISFFPKRPVSPSVRNKRSSDDTDDTEINDRTEKESNDTNDTEKEKTDTADDRKIRERQERFKRYLSGKKEDPPESIFKKWRISFGHEKEMIGLENAVPVNAESGNLNLPSVPWHTSLYFDDPGDAWNVVYTRNQHPVIIEKHMGKGSIVLSTGSFYFSNESLFNERQTDLLVWFLGRNKHFIFDESHFGIQKNTGVVDLARKYRLYWFVLGGMILAGLFVWKNTSVFVPPVEEADIVNTQGISSSRDYKDGMVSLLRRNIQTQDILPLCVGEWKKSFISGGEMPEQTRETLAGIQEVLAQEEARAPKHRNTVNTYRLISQIVNKRKMI